MGYTVIESGGEDPDIAKWASSAKVPVEVARALAETYTREEIQRAFAQGKRGTDTLRDALASIAEDAGKIGKGERYDKANGWLESLRIKWGF